VEAAVKALRDGHHGYTPARGVAELRQAVAADLHRRLDVEVDPDLILAVPGGKVTMFFAVLMFGEPGAEIVYPNPGFPIYESAIRFSGATPVPLPLKESEGFAFSAEALLALVSDKTRLIIINSPANPTGGVTPRAEVEKLVAGLARHPKVALLSDEIYGQMTYDGGECVSLLSFPEIREQLILLDGWSKTYAMTGWRLGYAVWPRSLIEAATRLAINCHSCVNAATQQAGIAALTGPQDALHRMVAAFDERRKAVVDGLNGLPGVSCIAPGGAFYAFPNIGGTGIGAKALETGLLETAGVATIAGTSFGRYGDGYLRLSYANTVENIREGIARMGDYLSSGAAARRA
ncbi:MAG: pyridoxal phosphate-dependent aminotransferase, partial [Kiloniellales bacterium]